MLLSVYSSILFSFSSSTTFFFETAFYTLCSCFMKRKKSLVTKAMFYAFSSPCLSIVFFNDKLSEMSLAMVLDQSTSANPERKTGNAKQIFSGKTFFPEVAQPLSQDRFSHPATLDNPPHLTFSWVAEPPSKLSSMQPTVPLGNKIDW